jgi:hypothetical protein
MSVLDNRTSSANGALGRQPRQDSAGITLVTAPPLPKPWTNDERTGVLHRADEVEMDLAVQMV